MQFNLLCIIEQSFLLILIATYLNVEKKSKNRKLDENYLTDYMKKKKSLVSIKFQLQHFKSFSFCKLSAIEKKKQLNCLMLRKMLHHHGGHHFNKLKCITSIFL